MKTKRLESIDSALFESLVSDQGSWLVGGQTFLITHYLTLSHSGGDIGGDLDPDPS
jgi:hypothetical protein